ncbi:MFS transporter [Streptomyces sp. NPDC001691]|uniref:MFS transporter n=1 Tax=Streptomyces sp. NPDC001691 TaxID=3364600 RepID=UPI0036997557
MTTTVTSTTRVAPSMQRSRLLLIGYFATLGVVMAVWGARMPAVRAAADLQSGGLAVVLLSAAAGMVGGLLIGGRIAHRLGSSRLLVLPAVGFGFSLVLLGQGRSLLTLSLAAAVFGAFHGLLDVGANASAVTCERAYGRPIMSGFHCAYSAGALLGAALTAVTAWLPHDLLFAAVGILVSLAAVTSSRTVRTAGHLDADAGASPGDEDEAALPRRSLWLLGALAAACLLCEGAAVDWSAVHIKDLGGSETLAAAAFAVYSAAMAVGRLCGDRMLARYGHVTVVRIGAGLGAVGLAIGVVSNSIPIAMAGWAAVGLGLSTAVPSLISAAGRGGPRAVGTVAATGYLGLLAGPALIGALASWTSLPTALYLPVLMAAVMAATTRRALRP